MTATGQEVYEGGMRSTLLLGTLALGACDGGAAADPVDGVSADAVAAADAAAAPDALPSGCVCDGVEDCRACFENIGRCCYDDPTLFGQLERLADTCQASAPCAVCCAECAQRSCEAVRAAGDCPNVEPSQQGP